VSNNINYFLKYHVNTSQNSILLDMVHKEMIEVTEFEDGTFRFYLKNEHNCILMTSEIIKSDSAVQKIIGALSQANGNVLRFERITNHQGNFLFNVKNTNGISIGHSELYSSEAGMENGIRNLKILLSGLQL